MAGSGCEVLGSFATFPPNLMRESSLRWMELKDLIRSNGFEDVHVAMREDYSGRFPYPQPTCNACCALPNLSISHSHGIQQSAVLLWDGHQEGFSKLCLALLWTRTEESCTLTLGRATDLIPSITFLPKTTPRHFVNQGTRHQN